MTSDDGTAGTLRPPQHDEFFWTSHIWKHIKAGQSKQALEMFRELQDNGFKPSSYTFVAVLKACSCVQDLACARRIHAEVVKCGFQSIVFVANSLVHAYAKCGSLVDARHVFESMPYRNVVSWNSMIFGYASAGDGAEALHLYGRMKQEGGRQDGHTFLGALKACSSLAAVEEYDGILTKERCLQRVRAIHSDIVRRGAMSDLFVANMLVDVYGKCGSLPDARFVFRNISHRTAVSWTAMILAHVQAGEGEVALKLYAQMRQEGVQPDAQAYVGALKASSSKLASLEQGCKTNGMTLRKQCLDQVRAIHSDVVKSGSESNIFVGSLLVDVYAKCGSLDDARNVFDKMPQRNVVSWTAMIVGYAQLAEGGTALKLFARMQEAGVLPNDRTFAGALKACGVVAGLETGRKIHSQLLKSGCKMADPLVALGLIDMYCKCGSMVDAQQVFDTLCTTDTLTWSALIAGYAQQGESARVFDLFAQMKVVGILPVATTFLSLLTVCSREGLVDKGQAYFNAMSQEYGVNPTIEHYTCMVDLLGRAGQVEEAMAMVRAMPFQPDGVVWRTVLGACRKWKNVELGQRAFECAIQLDKNDASAYVLMSNIYAVAHMPEAAREIQTTRMKNGSWKTAGQSWWTDPGGRVHAFLVGDREHPEMEAIYVKVENLLGRMKAAGCIPCFHSVSQDSSDEQDDRASLCWHTERLTAAYAVLKALDRRV